ncbi:MAG: gliding motility-associated C-terminal domain-containing protein [Bacteroidota bacterium]
MIPTDCPFVFRSDLRILWVGLLLSLCLSARSQPNPQQANRWIFGNGYGLDFSSGEAVPDHNNAIFTYEASTVMCGKEGQLLFYTNSGGRQDGSADGFIWNRLHQPMKGGRLLPEEGGGYSAAQGCVALPRPEWPDRYFLFTVDEFETMTNSANTLTQGKGLSLFEIDMQAEGGFGEVIRSNEKILLPSFEYLTATIHENCIDYWLLALSGHYHLERNPDVADSIYVFPVTADGPQTPLVFPLPEGEKGVEDEYGMLRLSPDGSRLICGRYLYSFDKSTGQISDPQDLYGIFSAGELSQWCFSPDGKLLYRFREQVFADESTLSIVQIDLSASPLASSAISLGTTTYKATAIFGSPQIGPNGKIYTLVQPLNTAAPTEVTVLHQPNLRGERAELEFNHLTITKSSGDSRFLRFGNFADHLFYQNFSLPLDLGPDVLLDCFDPAHRLEGPPGMECYRWSDGSMAPSLDISLPGLYWLEVRRGCIQGRDTVWADWDLAPLDDLEVGADTVLCDGDTLWLEPTVVDAAYRWQDGQQEDRYAVWQSGTYAVTATLGNCEKSDSLAVEFVPLPTLDLLAGDTVLCLEDELDVMPQADHFDDFSWRDGHPNLDRTISEAGQYELTLSGACGTVSSSLEVSFEDCTILPCQIYVPNVFSPNQDGVNDDFLPQANRDCQLTDFHLQIFNRWGGLVFESHDQDQGWDGRYSNQKDLEMGVYVWVLTYEQAGLPGRKQLQGDLTLLR